MYFDLVYKRVYKHMYNLCNVYKDNIWIFLIQLKSKKMKKDNNNKKYIY